MSFPQKDCGKGGFCKISQSVYGIKMSEENFFLYNTALYLRVVLMAFVGLNTMALVLPCWAGDLALGSKEKSVGIFPLSRENQTFISPKERNWVLKKSFLDVISRPYVSGISLWISWETVEPKQKEYNWEPILNVAHALAAVHKDLNIGIGAGPFSPKWIYQDGVVSYTYTMSQTEKSVVGPVPWDDKYLQLYSTLIKQLGQLAANDPELRAVLKRVVIGGPGNTQGLEMVITGSDSNIEYYKSVGYPDKFVKSWEHMVDVFKTSFLNNVKLVLIWHRGMRGHWTNMWSDEVFKYAIAHGLNTRIDLETCSLTGAGSYSDQHDLFERDPSKIKEMLRSFRKAQLSGINIGFQFYAPFPRDGETNDQNELVDYDNAYKNANELGATWVEPWIEDFIRNVDDGSDYITRMRIIENAEAGLESGNSGSMVK